MEILCDASDAEPEDVLILDAGSGIRELGKKIAARTQAPKRIHLFFSHFHWDHLQGLPFFLPLFSTESEILFYSAHEPDELRAALSSQMQYPFFPVLFGQIPACLEFHRIGRESQQVGPAAVSSFPLHHPQGSVGYRVRVGHWSAVYATDHEHGEKSCDRELLHAAQGAHVLVYDAQYTPEESESRTGWGHSNWQRGAALARAAGVKDLALFHHDPDRDDDGVRDIETAAREVFPQTHAAREGLLL